MCTLANLGGATPVFAGGESMNVVTEKRLAEVQAQYEHMRSSWIDPGQHEAIKKQLSMEQHTKQTYEVNTDHGLKKFYAKLQTTEIYYNDKKKYVKKNFNQVKIANYRT